MLRDDGEKNKEERFRELWVQYETANAGRWAKVEEKICKK